MVAYCVEDLQVYRKAVAAADAIFALTEKPAFNRDLELRRQLRASSGRVPSHISEGFGQGTDRHFRHYLTIARGSAKETKTHLRRALGNRYINEAEYTIHWEMYDEIAAMLSGLIKHLERENRPRRG